MPTVNIPARVRFALYLLGALALIGVGYAVDKAWAGDAEVRLVTALAALLNLLAASKTTDAQGRILGKAFHGGTFSKADEDARRNR